MRFRTPSDLFIFPWKFRIQPSDLCSDLYESHYMERSVLSHSQIPYAVAHMESYLYVYMFSRNLGLNNYTAKYARMLSIGTQNENFHRQNTTHWKARKVGDTDDITHISEQIISKHMSTTSVRNLSSENKQNRIFTNIPYMTPDCCVRAIKISTYCNGFTA